MLVRDQQIPLPNQPFAMQRTTGAGKTDGGRLSGSYGRAQIFNVELALKRPDFPTEFCCNCSQSSLSADRLSGPFGIRQCSEWPVRRPAVAKSRLATNVSQGPL